MSFEDNSIVETAYAMTYFCTIDLENVTSLKESYYTRLVSDTKLPCETSFYGT